MPNSLSRLSEVFQQATMYLVGECFALHPELHKIAEQYPERSVLLPMSDTSIMGVAMGIALDGNFPIVSVADPRNISNMWNHLAEELAAIENNPDFSISLCLVCPLHGVALSSVPINNWIKKEWNTHVWHSRSPIETAYIVAQTQKQHAISIILESEESSAIGLHSPSEVQILCQHPKAILTIISISTNQSVLEEVMENHSSIPMDVILLQDASSNASVISESVYNSGRVVLVDTPTHILSQIIEKAFWRLEAQPQSCIADAQAISKAISSVVEK